MIVELRLSYPGNPFKGEKFERKETLAGKSGWPDVPTAVRLLTSALLGAKRTSSQRYDGGADQRMSANDSKRTLG
jgi:hypothetical protein